MTAKEMFEKLGYKQEKSKNTICYSIKFVITEICYIEFNLVDKTINSCRISDSPFSPSRDAEISFEELQAINKQVEELGWNKED
ncbi:MAG: hypothetical protein SOT91_04160 [Bacilli bacterium]|nr:hypothetical protein [Bacilli bacterium]